MWVPGTCPGAESVHFALVESAQNITFHAHSSTEAQALHHRCDGLKDYGPTGSQEVALLGGMVFVGGRVSLGAGFEVSDVQARLSVSWSLLLPGDQDVAPPPAL